MLVEDGGVHKALATITDLLERQLKVSATVLMLLNRQMTKDGFKVRALAWNKNPIIEPLADKLYTIGVVP